MNNRAARLR